MTPACTQRRSLCAHPLAAPILVRRRVACEPSPKETKGPALQVGVVSIGITPAVPARLNGQSAWRGGHDVESSMIHFGKPKRLAIAPGDRIAKEVKGAAARRVWKNV